MKPSKEEMRDRWREFKRVAPADAAALAPFIKEFGCDYMVFVRFERDPKPDHPLGHLKHL